MNSQCEHNFKKGIKVLKLDFKHAPFTQLDDN